MKVDPLVPESPRYLGQGSFQFRVAPRRRALLVRDHETDQLRRAMLAAAALWGGARNPFMVVDSDGHVAPVMLQIAELLDCVEAADFTIDEQRTQSAWTHRHDCAIVPVPARPLTDAAFWNAHPAVIAGDGLTREIHLPNDQSLVALAGAGGYGLAEELPLFRQAGFKIVEGCSIATQATAQISEATALGATLVGDVDSAIYGGSMASLGLLWVAENQHSFEDAHWFWNARALRPRYRQPSPVEVLTTQEVAAQPEFQHKFAAAVARTSTTTPSFIFASATVPDHDLQKLAQALGAELHTGPRFTERLGYKVSAEQPLTFTVNHDPAQFWAVRRSAGAPQLISTPLERPRIQLRAESPREWVPKYVGSGKVVATISSPSIAGPPVPAVARLFHSDALWSSGDGIRLVTNNLPHYSWSIDLPDPSAVLTAALNEQGLAYEQSDKGQQVQGVLAAPGDHEFYRHRSTILAVQLLTAKAGRDFARELKTLREQGQVSQESIDALRATSLMGHRPYRTMGDLKSQARSEGVDPQRIPAAMEGLVARGAAFMGLVVACSLCSLTDFQPLPTIPGGAVCRGCGAAARYKTTGSGSPEIHFELSTLMHTLSLNGGLAPLAATTWLGSQGFFVEPGANLYRGRGQIGELDLLGWKGSELVAGEAKTSRAGFSYADISRDVALAASTGADSYLAVCLEELPEDIRSQLDSACESSDELSPR